LSCRASSTARGSPAWALTHARCRRYEESGCFESSGGGRSSATAVVDDASGATGGAVGGGGGAPPREIASPALAARTTAATTAATSGAREPLAARRPTPLDEEVEVGGELGRACVARVAGLGHGLLPDRDEVARRAGGPIRFLLEDGVEELRGRRAVEGRGAGEEEEERRAERVDVGALVERGRAGALGLLGRHVGRRPEHDARLREPFGAGVAREAEVEEDRHAVGREDHVVGLQVAVEDPVPVDLLDREGEVAHDLGGAAWLERLLAHGLSERLALDEIGDEVVAAVLGAVERVDHDDRRMPYAREEARLAPEALELAGRGAVVEDQLEREPARGLGMADLVDDAHAAAAELADDLVGSDPHAGESTRRAPAAPPGPA
jgi:hypothetical protein